MSSPRRDTVTRALKVLAEGTAGLSISRSYRKTLQDRVRAAKQPMTTAKAICRDLRKVHAGRGQPPPARPDLSAAQEARVAQIRRQPEHHRAKAFGHHAILMAEKALLQGELSQAAFDARMSALSAAPVPAWMFTTTPPSTAGWDKIPRPSVRLRSHPSSDPFPSEWLEIPAFLDRRRPKLRLVAGIAIPSTMAA